MKAIFSILLCTSFLLMASCSKEVAVESETNSSSLEAEVSKSKAVAPSISVSPCDAGFYILVSGLGNGMIISYSIYDMSGNLVDGAIETISGSSLNTSPILSTCTQYRVDVSIRGAGLEFNEIRTSDGCNGAYHC